MTNYHKGRNENLEYYLASNKELYKKPIPSGQIAVIGDIDIHNRTQLINKYVGTDKCDYELENDELVCLLYKKVGIKFLDDLVGEFSFIILDPIKEKTFAVRDQIGIKTMFWTKCKGDYIFASDIFLLKDFIDFKKVNYEYFKEYYIRNGIIDLEITPYHNVFRIPSASYLSVVDSIPKITTYWDLSNIYTKIRYRNEKDYQDRFREILKMAVKDRLVRGNRNSVMLSGGLDSTSIYALSKGSDMVAEDIIVSPVSAVFDELKECDESEYIIELLKKYNDQGYFVNCDNVGMLDNFSKNFSFSYEPNVNSITYNFTNETIKKSIESGMDNVISGYAGDHLLTGSLYIASDFLRQLKIGKLFEYITSWSILMNSSAVQNMKKYSFSPNIIKDSLAVDENHPYFNLLSKKIAPIKHYHQKDLYLKIMNAKSHLYTDRVIGAINGADIKHPFLDRRLIEFVYQIPGELRRSKDITKYILRSSMKSFLTENIVARVNKTMHVTYFYKNIRENWPNIFNELSYPRLITKLKLISEEKWREELIKWRNGLDVNEGFWALLAIELWYSIYQKQNLV